MNKMLEWGRMLWLEAELAAPPIIQRTMMPRLHEAKEIVRLLLRPYLTVYQWQGQGRGGPLTVSYVGLGYASLFLQSLLFTEKPAEREIGRIPVWSLSKQVDALSSDLTIIEASKRLIRRLCHQGAVSLPFRLHYIVKVQREWEDLWRSFRKSARKQDVRLVRKYSYEYQLSRKQEDLEMFYHTMYVPTTSERHGEQASIVAIERLCQYFRHGLLLFIKRDGRIVSGGLCSIQHKTVSLVVTGVVDADHQLTREGAVTSIYYFLIRWAHKEGYHTVDLGAGWPFLADGIFQFKRKWGSTVIVPPREHKQIWIRVQRDTPGVSQYMRDNPCVAIGKGGELRGIIVTDNPDDVTPKVRSGWQKQYATPGLSDLLVCSIADLLNKPEKGDSAYND